MSDADRAPEKAPDNPDEPATEAVAYDPFADDDPATEAVAFDPFALDDSDGEEPAYANLGDMAELLKDLDALREGQGDGAGRDATSQRSRREALDTFRELRGAKRAGRAVADGMVELPWIAPTDPKEALKDPTAAVVQKGLPAPPLHPSRGPPPQRLSGSSSRPSSPVPWSSSTPRTTSKASPGA